MPLPTIETYGNYSNLKAGANCIKVEVGPVQVWYSYTTPVAFRVGPVFAIRRNDWGTTTGRHLNAIDGGDSEAKSERVDEERFEALWDEHVAPIFEGALV